MIVKKQEKRKSTNKRIDEYKRPKSKRAPASQTHLDIVKLIEQKNFDITGQVSPQDTTTSTSFDTMNLDTQMKQGELHLLNRAKQ